ncbi:MAG: glycosyltransferase family 2 protein [Nitrososphaerales archaeon]
MLLYELIQALLISILLIIGFWWVKSLKQRVQYEKSVLYLKPKNYKGDLPYLSVIIPARNEEKHIRNLLLSLKNQDLKEFEVIIVDDDSQDNTLKIAKEFEEVKLISLKELKDKWVGKNWACYKGAKIARGEWLLFTDADSKFTKDALREALSFCINNDLELLSLAPHINCVGFWSKVTTPLYKGLMNLLLPMVKVNDPRSKTVYLFGSFIMVKASSYWKIGGHEAVKDEMVEDRALGTLAKKEGIKIMLVKGDSFFSSNWVEGFRELWQALVRIFFQGVARNRRGAMLFAIALFFIGVMPLLSLLLTFAFFSANLLTLITMILSLINYLLPLGVLHFEIKDLKISKIYSLLHPLAFSLLIAALILSILKVKRGKVLWRGRYYPANFN